MLISIAGVSRKRLFAYHTELQRFWISPERIEFVILVLMLMIALTLNVAIDINRVFPILYLKLN